MCTLKVVNNKVIQATEEYLNRKTRKSHPDGKFDKSRRWYPSDKEACEDCYTVREPSRSFPYSIMTHCRSIGHIAKKHKVDASVIRKISGQVLKMVKLGVEISTLEAADIVVNKDKNYIAEQGLLSGKVSPECCVYTSQDFPDGGVK